MTDRRKTPRAMLAAIALAAAPVPQQVTFTTPSDGGPPYLSITPEDLSDARLWASLLGLEYEDYLNDNGIRYLRVAPTQWHGWKIHLWASGPGDKAAVALPNATQVALAEAAAEEEQAG